MMVTVSQIQAFQFCLLLSCNQHFIFLKDFVVQGRIGNHISCSPLLKRRKKYGSVPIHLDITTVKMGTLWFQSINPIKQTA